MRTTFILANVSSEGRLGLPAKAGRWCAGRGWARPVLKARVDGGGIDGRLDMDGSLGLEGREMLDVADNSTFVEYLLQSFDEENILDDEGGIESVVDCEGETGADMRGKEVLVSRLLISFS